MKSETIVIVPLQCKFLFVCWYICDVCRSDTLENPAVTASEQTVPRIPTATEPRTLAQALSLRTPPQSLAARDCAPSDADHRRVFDALWPPRGEHVRSAVLQTNAMLRHPEKSA
jgi:hypothetical protein